MLDIRWLEDLATIAETRNLTRAAEFRNVTQSGLSRRLQSLEHWAGTELINRRKSPIELTEAGEQLLAVSTDVIGRLNGARRAIREDADDKLKSVRFAAPHILSVTFFPKWLPTVQRHIGAARLTILSDNLPGCCEAFDHGAVDFVACFIDARDELLHNHMDSLSISTCQSVVVGTEKLIPLSAPISGDAPQHCLSRGSQSSVSYLGYNTSCSLGWAVNAQIEQQADLPRLTQVYENSLADGLRSMTLSGLGVAWLPLSTTHQDILRGRLVRAAGPELDIDLQIRIFRPQRRLSRRSEEMWTALATSGAIVELPSVPPVALPSEVAG